MKYLGNLINLESVGTGLDKDGMTYVMLADGGYDFNSGIHLDDIERDGDWMLALSDADKIRISQVLDNRPHDQSKE